MSYTIPLAGYVQVPTYAPVEDASQLFVGFETGAQILVDMAEDLNAAYALLDDDERRV